MGVTTEYDASGAGREDCSAAIASSSSASRSPLYSQRGLARSSKRISGFAFRPQKTNPHTWRGARVATLAVPGYRSP